MADPDGEFSGSASAQLAVLQRSVGDLRTEQRLAGRDLEYVKERIEELKDQGEKDREGSEERIFERIGELEETMKAKRDKSWQLWLTIGVLIFERALSVLKVGV